MSKVLLYSGGLDCSCAWWILGKPPILYCGGAHGPNGGANLGEMRALIRQRAVCPEFEAVFDAVRMNFEGFRRRDEWHFPREQVLCQLAWGRGYSGAYLAWCKDDGTTPEYAARAAERFASAVWTGDRAEPFEVEFPVAHLSKVQLVKQALLCGAPRRFLEVSWSCVRQSDEPCGKCNDCKARIPALAEELSV